MKMYTDNNENFASTPFKWHNDLEPLSKGPYLTLTKGQDNPG